jgi:uroporphyrinogen decarboxylase
MTSKERVLAAFDHTEPDRVPINYLCNPGIDRRLKAHFGLGEKDDEALRQRLNVDFRNIPVRYTGPVLHEAPQGIGVDEWGKHRRWIEHESGGYWDYCVWPLRDADMDAVERWPMPSPDDYDYTTIDSLCDLYSDYALVIGNPGVADVINSTGMVRTMEQVLIDLMTDDPACLRYIERKTAITLEVTERTLDQAAGQVDLLWIGEDLGTQIGPMISVDLYRKCLRPIHEQFIDLATAYDVPVMVHSCGSSSWAFPDFIEMGVRIVDTLQPEASNMAPTYLKSTYGEQLAFHGAISTAGAVTYGSPEDTRHDVQETLEAMMPGGGYALAPTHQLQDNSPTENVVALYETAISCGGYA